MRIRGQLRRVLGAGVMCSHSQRPARSCLPMAPLTKVFSRQMARIRCPLSKRWAKNSFLMCPLWSGVDVGLGTANSPSALLTPSVYNLHAQFWCAGSGFCSAKAGRFYTTAAKAARR